MNPNLLFNSANKELLFVKFEDPDDIQGACAKAAKYRLAVPGWSFFEIFRAGRDRDESEYQIDKLTMAFCNATGVPVATAVAFHGWGDFNAGCFVRKDYRRRRIGSRLIKDLLFMDSRPVRIHEGVLGSPTFWHTLGASDEGYIRESSAPV